MTNKWPSNERKMLIKNNVRTVLITNVCPPDWGSIILAIERPAVDAIFSALTDAAEKRMLSNKPTESPKPISESIIKITFKIFISLTFGTLKYGKIKIDMLIDKTILAWSGIKDIEKNGILIKSAEILSDEKKNEISNWYKL